MERAHESCVFSLRTVHVCWQHPFARTDPASLQAGWRSPESLEKPSDLRAARPSIVEEIHREKQHLDKPPHLMHNEKYIFFEEMTGMQYSQMNHSQLEEDYARTKAA